MKLQQSFTEINKSIHDLKSFDCGKPEMNTFLTRFAQKHMQAGLSSTWVLPVIAAATKKMIAAYYTLAASAVHREELPTTKSLPRYPISVALLARLAVDSQFQGQHLGEKTLVYALRHAVALCDRGLPAFGLILDVLDEEALRFYQKFELFEPFTDNPMRLFVSMTTLRKI